MSIVYETSKTNELISPSLPIASHGRQLNEVGTPFQYSAHHFCHSVRRIPVGKSVVRRISGIHSEQIQFRCMDSVQI
jgi:hypothetical protein